MKRIFLPLVVTAVLFSMMSAKAFYDPSIGRWVNRDPIGELGGNNIYAFVGNDAINYIDFFGLEKDQACLDKCAQDLANCYNAKKILSYGLGGGIVTGGLQVGNKTATKPPGGVAGGGPSGRSTSWTRKCFGRAGRAVGRASVGSAAAVGAGVGMIALHVDCFSSYLGCRAGCPDKNSCQKPPDDCND